MTKLKLKVSSIVNLFKKISGLTAVVVDDHASLYETINHIIEEKDLDLVIAVIEYSEKEDTCIINFSAGYDNNSFIEHLKLFENLLR